MFSTSPLSSLTSMAVAGFEGRAWAAFGAAKQRASSRGTARSTIAPFFSRGVCGVRQLAVMTFSFP